MKIALPTLGLVLSVGLFSFFPVGASSTDPPTTWVNPDESKFTNRERVVDRPGNYSALAAISSFYSDIHLTRPVFKNCGFPLQYRSRWFTKLSETESWLDKQLTIDKAPTNALRKYNITIRSVVFFDAANVDKDASLLDKLGQEKANYQKIRKEHKGRGIVAIVANDLESLQSDKKDTLDDSNFLLSYIDGFWRVTWYED